MHHHRLGNANRQRVDQIALQFQHNVSNMNKPAKLRTLGVNLRIVQIRRLKQENASKRERERAKRQRVAQELACARVPMFRRAPASDHRGTQRKCWQCRCPWQSHRESAVTGRKLALAGNTARSAHACHFEQRAQNRDDQHLQQAQLTCSAAVSKRS